MASSSLLPVALFVIMLGVGMTLKWADFRPILVNPKMLFIGLVGQLLMLPLLGWVIVLLFDLPPVYAVGLMILCFAPGGATSNMLTLLARGDTALSVSLTAISGLIIPFSLPLLTYLSLQNWMGEDAALQFPVIKSIAQIFVITVLPALIGIIISERFPDLSFKMRKPVKLVSILFMVLVVIGLVRANSTNLLEQLNLLGLPILLLATLAISMGYLLGRIGGLDSNQQCTLGIEIGVQNAGTAILVAGGLLHNPMMALTALSYGVLMNVPAVILLIYRNRNLFSPRQAVRLG